MYSQEVVPIWIGFDEGERLDPWIPLDEPDEASTAVEQLTGTFDSGHGLIAGDYLVALSALRPEFATVECILADPPSRTASTILLAYSHRCCGAK